jgi:hypothetical protein
LQNVSIIKGWIGEGLYGYLFVEDSARNITRFVRKERSSGIIKYVGWTVVGRVLCAAAHIVWNKRTTIPPLEWWRTATSDDISQWAEEHLGSMMDGPSSPTHRVVLAKKAGVGSARNGRASRSR